MKKVILNSLLIVALVLSAAFTSCKSKGSGDVKSSGSVVSNDRGLADETPATINDPEAEHELTESNGVKILETIIGEDGSLSKFEYDDKNRMVKMYV